MNTDYFINQNLDKYILHTDETGWMDEHRLFW